MAQTPFSSSAPYVTAQQALSYVAPSIVADILRPTPESPRPSYLSMIDPANPAGQRWLTYLRYGAGEIEAWCGVARRYTPDDLRALTGDSADFLQGLNTARALWRAFQFLRPATARPDECPGARESAEFLKMLGDGTMIFGFVDTMDAGLPSVQQASPSQLLTPNIVGRAVRIFPGYGQNRLIDGDS